MEQQILDHIDEALGNLHTITIAKITGVNGSTVNVKPITNRIVKGESVQLPEFIEVPAFNISGGGSSLSMPISAGDYAILLFSEDNFDAWWSGKDFSDPHDTAKFDYSNAIALVGLAKGGATIPSVATFIGDILFKDKLTYTEIETSGSVGVSGSFTSNDGKTITVKNGIITEII